MEQHKPVSAGGWLISKGQSARLKIVPVTAAEHLVANSKNMVS